MGGGQDDEMSNLKRRMGYMWRGGRRRHKDKDDFVF